jgi:hypothetical protein
LLLGHWNALLTIVGIWDIWHVLAFAQAHNCLGHSILGDLLMPVMFVVLGVLIGWLFLNTGSLWVEALGFPSLNAWTGLPAYC